MTSSMFLQSAEPPPAGWGGVVESTILHAEKHSEVFFPLLSACIPLALLVGAAVVYVRWHLPAWREEQKANRENLAKIVGDQAAAAKEDQAQTRELARFQQDAIVQRVEGSVSRQTGELQKISDRLERHGELLRTLAAKSGVVLLLLLLIACPAPLVTQQTLADRVRAATAQCKALPVSPAKTATCTRALLCQTQALAAASALQRVNEARTKNDTDVETETSAAGLSVIAEVACCAWAKKPCKR